MKKLLLGILLLSSIMSFAQTNIQTHYDFGKNRNYLTTTLEMFKADDWGSTYFFVDYDYNAGKHNNPSCSYFEVSRALKFWNGPISAHLEYNGGVGNANGFGFSIRNAFLTGLNYDIHNKDYSKTFTIEFLYKYIQGGDHIKSQNSAQITAVWNLNFFNKKVTFDGFADLWIEDNQYANNALVFITEPQIWYNFNGHLSAGSEIEISSRFCSNKVRVNPTLAFKWNF